MSHTSPRVYTPEDRLLPRFLIRGMIALVLAALAIATYARITDRPLVSTPPVAPVVAEAAVTFHSDGVSGAVTVLNADGTVLTDLSAEDGGFIAGIHRVIIRERTKHRVAFDGPVILQAYDNGRMAIHDPSTGWGADLMGFGADNAGAFARLLAQSQKGND